MPRKRKVHGQSNNIRSHRVPTTAGITNIQAMDHTVPFSQQPATGDGFIFGGVAPVGAFGTLTLPPAAAAQQATRPDGIGSAVSSWPAPAALHDYQFGSAAWAGHSQQPTAKKARNAGAFAAPREAASSAGKRAEAQLEAVLAPPPHCDVTPPQAAAAAVAALRPGGSPPPGGSAPWAQASAREDGARGWRGSDGPPGVSAPRAAAPALQLERVSAGAVCATDAQLVQIVRALLRPRDPLFRTHRVLTAQELSKELTELATKHRWGQLHTRGAGSKGELLIFRLTSKWLKRNCGPGAFERVAKERSGGEWQHHAPDGDESSVISLAEITAGTRRIPAPVPSSSKTTGTKKGLEWKVGGRVLISSWSNGEGSRSKSHIGGGAHDIGLIETVGVSSGYEGFLEVRAACGIKEWHKTKDLVATDAPFRPNDACIWWAMTQRNAVESAELVLARENEHLARLDVKRARNAQDAAEQRARDLANRLEIIGDEGLKAVQQAAAGAAAPLSYQRERRSLSRQRPRSSSAEPPGGSPAASPTAASPNALDFTAVLSEVTKGLEEAKQQVVESERQKHQLLAVIESLRSQQQGGLGSVAEAENPSMKAEIENLKRQNESLKRQSQCGDAANWICPGCSNENWPLRTECNRCGDPKPHEAPQQQQQQQGGPPAMSDDAEAGLRAEIESLKRQNKAQADRRVAAEALEAKERKTAEARALKAQISAKESAKEAAETKRQLETALKGLNAMETTLEGLQAEAAGAAEVAGAAARAQARLSAIVATSEDTAQHLLQAFRHVVTDHVQPRDEAAKLVNMAEGYARESAAVVAELADGESEASREVVALLGK